MLSACSVDLQGREAPAQDDSLTTEPDAASVDASLPGQDDASQPTKTQPDAGPPHHPMATPDASIPEASMPEASIPDASHDSGPTTNACTNVSGPCVVVPSGWTLVAFAPAQNAACPAGFDTTASQDLFEGPGTGAGACSCSGCSVKQDACGAGSIAVHYDTDSSQTCGTVANPSPLSNSPPGACLTDIFQGSYAIYDVQYTAPPPSGGSCSAPAVPNGNAVTYAAKDRICQLNDPQAASCANGICKPVLSGSYAACIASPGHVACPPGPLSVAHDVGSSASFTCADCACSIISGTCSGTLTLYTDTGCKSGGYPIATDVCVAVSSRSSFKAYQYAGAAPTGVTCQAGAPGAAQNVALTGEQTICCAQ
jgi:hypothetical protein